MDTENLNELLRKWKRRIMKSIDAHYASERYYRKLNKKIGIPIVVLGVVISSLSFYFIGKEVPLWAQLLVGFAGLSQIVLASLHTWLKYSELAEKHHEAGTNYAAVRRRIEQHEASENITDDEISSIRTHLDEISKTVPAAPGHIWSKTQKAYGGHGTADGEILSGIHNNRNSLY